MGGPSRGVGQRHLPIDPPEDLPDIKNSVNEKIHSLVLRVLTKQRAVKILIEGSLDSILL